MITIVKRLISALWPLLFVPLVLIALKSGKLGQHEDLVFQIDEPMMIAASIYILIYCGFWMWGKEHGTSVVASALITVFALGFWQFMDARVAAM